MSSNGDVRITGQLDTSEIDKSIKELTKVVENAATQMGQSIDKITNQLSSGFGKMGDVVDAVEKAMKKQGKTVKESGDDIKAAEGSINEYLTAHRNLLSEFKKTGDIDAFKEGMEDLEEVFNDAASDSVRFQAAMAKLKLPTALSLSTDQLKSIQDRSISESEISQLSYPEASQAVKQIDEIIQKEKLSVEISREYADLKDLAVKRMKQLSSTSEQVAQQELKQAQAASRAALDEAKIEKNIADAKLKSVEAEEKKAKAAKKTANIAKLQYDTENIEQRTALQTPVALKDLQNKSVVTITQSIKAYERELKKLDMTQKGAEDTAKQYRTEIARLNAANASIIGSTTRTRNALQRLDDGFKNLMTRMAFYVSVGAITGFARQIIQVRGEFEKTTIALGAIIKDFDRANNLFIEIQQSALKSPFTIMDLTTATKQLAAYNIAVEDLHPTMTMLADLSAGVGVEMQRLVVNFGQIRALGVANNRELKDFAVAGIPVYEELANRFTILEGRMVSAGEVFERVSNRMVSFEDVQAVLEGLTSEGGRFYNIQEEMSRSLAGRLSNLTDAYQLMYNEIGESTQGLLVEGIELLMFFAKNWEDLIPAIKTVGVAIAGLGIYKLGAGIIQLTHAAQALIVKFQALSVAAKIFSTSGVILAGLTLAYTYFSNVTTAAERLFKELDNIYKQYEATFDNTRRAFEKLAMQLKNTNVASEEHRNLIVSINSRYSEFLDFTLSEATALDKVYEAREQVIEGLRREQMVKSQSAAETKIREAYGEDIDEQAAYLEKSLSDLAKISENDARVIIERFKTIISQGSAVSIADVFADVMDGASLRDAIKESSQGFSLVSRDSQAEFNFLSSNADRLGDMYDAMFSTIKSESKTISNVFESASFDTYQHYLAVKKLNNEYEIQKKQIQSLGEITDNMTASEITQRESLLKTLSEEGVFHDKNNIEYGKYLTKLQQGVALEDFELKKVKERAQELYEINKLQISASPEFGLITQNKLKEEKNKIENWADETVSDVNAKLQLLDFSDEVKASLEITKNEASKGLLELIKTTQGYYENLLSEESRLLGLQKAGTSYKSERLTHVSEMVLGYKELLRLLGALPKEDTKIGKSSSVSVLSDQLELIKNITSKYKELVQLTENVDLATKETKKSYQELFNTLFTGTGLSIDSLITFDDTEIVKFFDRLETRAGANKPSVKVTIDEDEFIYSFDQLKSKVDEIKTQDSSLITEEDKIYINAYADLLKSAASQSKKDIIKIQEARSEYVFEARIELKEAELNKTQSKIEQAFRDYQIGLDIEGMGDYGEIMSRIFNVEGIDFNELESRLKTIISNATKDATDFAATITNLEAQRSKSTDPSEQASLDSQIANIQSLELKQTQIVKDAEKQRDDIRRENMKNQAIEWSKLLVEYDNYQARITKIQRDAEKDRLAVMNRTDIGDTNKTQITDAITNKEQQDIAGVRLEELEGSELYIQSLGDMQNIANEAIDPIIEMLERFLVVNKELDPTNIKALKDQIQSLYDLKSERGLADLQLMREELVKLQEETNKAESEEKSAEEQLLEADPTDVNNYTKAVNKLDAATKKRLVAQNKEFAQQFKLNNEISKSIQRYTDFSASVGDVISSAGDLAGVFDEDLGEAISKVGDSITEITNVSIGVITTLTTLTNAAGESMSVTAFMASTSIKTVEKASVILAVISAALQIATAIANLFIKDKSNTEEMDNLIASIDSSVQSLTNSFEYLEQSMESYGSTSSIVWSNVYEEIEVAKKAMSDLIDKHDASRLQWNDISSLQIGKSAIVIQAEEAKAAYEAYEAAVEKAEAATDKFGVAYIEQSKAQQARLIAEREAIDAQIAAEEAMVDSKGKDATDPEKIKEYEAALAELNAEIYNTQQALAETMFGTSVVSATEDMISGMLDAFRSGEDYMQVMENSFDSMIDNMIVKTIAGQVIGDRLQAIFDKMGKEGETLTTQQMADYAEELYSTAGAAAQDFEAWMEALKLAGLDLEGASESVDSELSNLQKGIQGITETQAGALEALWTTTVSNSFILNDLTRSILNISISSLAVQNAILAEIRAGNVTRAAIMELLSTARSDDGLAFKVDLR